MRVRSHEQTIDAMIAQGRSFDEVEAYIEEQDLDEEQRSVLWLWAWAELPRHERRATIPYNDLGA